MKKNYPPEASLIIPHKELSIDALNGIIEQFISRDGIDSGHIDISFEEKRNQVLNNLETGNAVLIFDNKTNSCNIVVNDKN